MIGPPGSTLWLLGHEMRLAWRGFTGGRRARFRVVLFAVLGVVFLAAAFPMAMVLRGASPPIAPLTVLAADFAVLVVFTLMLSQTLAGAAETLYARGDLDLLFSSPLAPRKVLTVRFAALAASAFAAFALLVTPFLIPLAIFGHWRWLAVLPVLAALALAAGAAGLALAVGLFALIGPRRTRAAAQVLAALIGAAFFLVSQAHTLLGGRAASLWTWVVSTAADPALRLPPLADWPLRAMLGEPLPLAALIAAGAALFLAVAAWLSRRFAADSAAAQGADAARPRARRHAPGSFAGSVFAATFVKELRLLRRDVALLSQVLLRVLYLIPAAFVLVRNAGDDALFLLPGGAAVLAFLSGQVASSLTWITVSAEDAPELLACAPARFVVVRNAKLAAGLAPLALLMAPLLIALAFFSPLTGLAAALGVSGSAVAAGLVNAWWPSPGKRSEFRRRRQGSLLIGLALTVVTGLIGAAAALVAIASPFAVAPALLAALALAALRQPPAKVAEAFAQAG